MNLTRLIYCSESIPSVELDLLQLIAISHKNNARAGITGFLFHDGQSFIQVLEGSRSATNALYHRIAADARHTGLVLIQYGDVIERMFPSWSMGLHQGIDQRTQDIFRRYFATSGIDPKTMNAESVLRMMRDLASDSADRAAASLAHSALHPADESLTIGHSNAPG